jgi:hypothetical protein
VLPADDSMQIPLHTFYLLRILYSEADSKKRNEYESLEDFTFYALLSMETYKRDSLVEKRPSAIYLNKLSDKYRSCIVSYRTAWMLAKIIPPRNVADRQFVLEEYLTIREAGISIKVQSDLTDESVKGDAKEIAELGSELEDLLLPQLEGCYKRSLER